MNRKLAFFGIGVVALVAVVAYVIFGVVLREPATASGPISAVPLANATALVIATQAPEPAAATAAAATSAPAATAAGATSVPAATEAAATADQLRYQIVSDQSEARFQLSEVLRGEPKTVIGKTNQVAGQLAVSPKDLSVTQLGTIKINARTLETDSAQRNRAINNFILNTSTYEFITFEPTAISGLTGNGALGQAYNFDIAGNLTIRDVTKPVVFKAQVQAESADRLVGKASGLIKRTDYNLTIPNVPFVANVGEDVTLEIDFVAAPI